MVIWYQVMEISVAVVTVVVLLWANRRFNLLINVVSIYGVIVLSPVIFLGTILFGLNMIIKEKNGMDRAGGCYMYQPMTWGVYIKFKFTGEGRGFA